MQLSPVGAGWSRVGPWFYRRPRLALVASVGAFAALAGWGLAQPAARSEAGVLVVFPTALLAVAFGLRGGLGGGAAALAVFSAWAASGGQDVDLPPWAAAAALLVLGLMVGNAVDCLARSEARAGAATEAMLVAEEAANRHRAATEINDRLVQEVAVAKWALESGRLEQAVSILDRAVGDGQRLVSELLGSVEAGRGRSSPRYEGRPPSTRHHLFRRAS